MRATATHGTGPPPGGWAPREKRAVRPQRTPPGSALASPWAEDRTPVPAGPGRHGHLPASHPRHRLRGGKRRPRRAGENGHELRAFREHLPRDQPPRSGPAARPAGVAPGFSDPSPGFLRGSRGAPAAHLPGPATGHFTKNRGVEVTAPNGLAPARAARASERTRGLRPRAAEPGQAEAVPARPGAALTRQASTRG